MDFHRHYVFRSLSPSTRGKTHNKPITLTFNSSPFTVKNLEESGEQKGKRISWSSPRCIVTQSGPVCSRASWEESLCKYGFLKELP